MSYTYDSLNRLATAATQANFGTPWGQSFTYDGFGNLTNVNVTQGSAPTLGATYNAATNHSSCADANGNSNDVSCNGGYTYDVENRVFAPWPNSGVNFYYAYAPGNKRVWRGGWTCCDQNGQWMRTTDEVTFWAPNGQKLGTYQLGFGYGTPGSNQNPLFYATQVGTYYYFGGRMIKNAGGYVYPDRLGSIGKFYPYGQERPSATQNGTEKFTGYLRDAETGLDYADQRYYQPGMGRFLTADRMRGDPKDPGSFNKYPYAGGDPINRTDLSGQDWVCTGPSDDPSCYLDFDPDPLTLEELCRMNVGGCQQYGLTFFQPPGQSVKGGGTPPSPSTIFHGTLNSDCQKGLTSAMPGADSDANDQARLDALSRGAAASPILEAAASAYGLDWRLLMAIGIEETGFQNLSGGGWFQFTPITGVSADCAGNLECAANAAAKKLAENLDALSGFTVRGQHLTGDALTTALLDSWNAGLGGVERALLRGGSADSASSNKHYGATALEVSKCYSQ